MTFGKVIDLARAAGHPDSAVTVYRDQRQPPDLRWRVMLCEIGDGNAVFEDAYGETWEQALEKVGSVLTVMIEKRLEANERAAAACRAALSGTEES